LETQSKNGAAIGLSIPLLPGSKEDEMIAQQITFRESNIKKADANSKRKLEIKTSSIFGKNGTSPADMTKKQLQIEMLTKKRKLTLQQQAKSMSPFDKKPTSVLLGSFSKTM
jgi:hypothetical protein